ncbi:hypothetical protein PoB_006046500 [Plakobranchus ocellatus]|uniref:Uncharacterized protein n=1 Tax=Plakobranchus ocellatus TaxID=259542 RepID=A0AAV4CPY3_9GAST|nr:hypothetical protein PoB_006046500 [Plakobranchus ocellatus]
MSFRQIQISKDSEQPYRIKKKMLLQSLPSCRRIALTLLLCACFSAVSGSDELDKLMKLLIDGLTDLARPTAENSDDYHLGVNLIG